MTSTNECLILAAGNGSRITSLSGSSPKPLVPLYGVPILEHIVMSAHAAGVEKFVIVVGYRANAIREWIADRSFEDISITLVENPNYNKANGVSALAAREYFRNPFLLLMADHIFEPATARTLMQQPLGRDEVILGVDYHIDRIFDLADATKVRLSGSDIINIGKELAHYQALDTGMFLCSPALFDRLDAVKKNGDCSLSDGMRELAREHKLKGFDIGEGRWQDVDTPEAFAYTERIFDRDFLASPVLEGVVHA
jgi:1L-myo-inositol 1-phosphate cytidylyltransferase